jgi:hypothetical protein
MRLAVTAAGAADGLYGAARGMVDFFASDIVEGFGERGCPLCRALERAETSEMESFLREGRKAREVRLSFYEGGGFCRRHAWLFHRLAAGKSTGVPIADIYGSLVTRDLGAIRRLEAGLAGRRRRLGVRLRRSAPCPACGWAAASLGRKAAFLIDALAVDAARARYSASEGLCYPHLVAAVERALETDREVARFLLHDWGARLERLGHDLDEYDRKRDHRCAHERKGAEQHSWTEVIRRYVGEDLYEDRAG